MLICPLDLRSRARTNEPLTDVQSVSTFDFVPAFSLERAFFPAVAPKTTWRLAYEGAADKPALAAFTWLPGLPGGYYQTLKLRARAVWCDKDPFAYPDSYEIVGQAPYKTITLGAAVSDGHTPIKLSGPDSVQAGKPCVATITLDGSPPAGTPVTLALSSSALEATVPSSKTISSSNTADTFTVTTSPVTAAKLVYIRATVGKVVQAHALTILPPDLKSLATSTPRITGGAIASITATIDVAAPTAGVTVALSDDSPYLATPSSIVVPAGGTAKSFNVSASEVTSTKVANITGRAGSTSRTIDPGLKEVVSNPAIVTGGQSATGTVRLYGLTPIDATVALSSKKLNSSRLNKQL